jgi:hypothetical protein
VKRALDEMLFLSACATSTPSPREAVARSPRLANLQRAAGLPWRDGGQCVVREASQPWPVLVERCFHALDHDRIRFNDPTGRCAVASAGAAAVGLGVCILAAPEIVVGAVIITGVVVVGFAIKEALDAYELKRGRPEVRPAPETGPSRNQRGRTGHLHCHGALGPRAPPMRSHPGEAPRWRRRA